jgi:hypothetical protein
VSLSREAWCGGFTICKMIEQYRASEAKQVGHDSKS